MLNDEKRGYILRINKGDWGNQVFEQKKYYTAMSKDWKRGMVVSFMRKRETWVSFKGYGVIERVDIL